jgi:ABC-type antimicrobial peptide transport system permease subunit
MVLRSAFMQTGTGLAVGLPVALLSVRYLKTQLYEVEGQDIGVMTTAIVTLAVAALIAGLIPARRAATIDPLEALRAE